MHLSSDGDAEILKRKKNTKQPYNVDKKSSNKADNEKWNELRHFCSNVKNRHSGKQPECQYALYTSAIALNIESYH